MMLASTQEASTLSKYNFMWELKMGLANRGCINFDLLMKSCLLQGFGKMVQCCAVSKKLYSSTTYSLLL
jgi:hypothetical protein